MERERNDSKAEQEKLNTQIQEFLKEVEVTNSHQIILSTLKHLSATCRGTMSGRKYTTSAKRGKIIHSGVCEITEPPRTLSLVDRCVSIRVCKHGCDVSNLRVFLRIILHKQ